MTPSTAWGNVKMYFGTPTSTGEMPTTLNTMGYILEDSLAIESEEGTTLELFEEGHILRDRLQLEGVISISATIIGIPDETRKAFWNVTESGTGDAKKVSVNSMVNNSKFAVKFAAEQVPGSILAQVCDLCLCFFTV
ncbi:hypothetical protein D0T49_12135 [Paludibacter sp. 221]|uniref:hypothetical protein n=1 Tax=Paludibacter sp. 221 TaxID=2302939 RepID=UPI0013D8C8D6|nr:hypothetical protein [Paludibacter sp. 221]NDV47795.1 hypothetical protein [Paludibacter sp. 221]